LKRKGLLIWALIGLLIFVMAIAVGSQMLVMLWDGYDVDEEKLMELCGITREEYFSPDFDPASCPEAVQAEYMVGGEEIMWPAVVFSALAILLVYTIISGIIYAVWRLVRKT
jgi:hypothetical protein